MKSFLTLFNRILGCMLALLGFAACDGENGGGQMCMYGVPTADFRVDGTVREAATKTPVEHARVVVQLGNSADTLSTNAEGYYLLEKADFPMNELRITVDDEAAVYESQTKTAELTYGGKKDAWYNGKAEVTIDFELEKLK